MSTETTASVGDDTSSADEGSDDNEHYLLEEEDDSHYDQGEDEEEEEEDDWQLMPRALPVGNDYTREPPQDAPPTSGEEYLRWVRWEAKKCPKIVVASDEVIEQHQIREMTKRQTVDSLTESSSKREDTTVSQPRKKQKNNNNKKRGHYGAEQVGGLADFVLPAPLPRCPPALKPSTQWESNFLNSFKEFRHQLEQQQRERTQQKPKGKGCDNLPRLKDSQRWRTFCLSDTTNLTPDVLATLDDVRVTTLLEYFSHWIKEERTHQLTKSEPETISTSSNQSVTSENVAISSSSSSSSSSSAGHAILTNSESSGAKWLYALLAKLETPIAAESASTLRDILRHCAEIRATLSSTDDARLPFLNILITVLSRFFGQGEQEE